MPYRKDHTVARSEDVDGVCMMGASRRGRSHAHNGTYRDDDFVIRSDKGGWFVVTVADGAGSAKYSRRGSDLMCAVATDRVLASVAAHCDDKFEKLLAQHRSAPTPEDEKQIRTILYKVLIAAGYAGVRCIESEARQMKAKLKDYATTLVLTVSKKYSFGWFVACFAIGDGGAALILDSKCGKVQVLNQQESGEFSGQTRFATMPEVWQDTDVLMKERLQFAIVDHFEALLAMTDGVSDPHFRTDVEFEDPQKWVDFWGALRRDARIDEGDSKVLLDWLNFWVDGEHDDRTIALLTPGEMNDQ
ncbi:protein phosphatase 2C domain-containing protein [bacterium]|nr:protein phosphatase 2C domain-containing protein [bacterium]